VSILCWLVDTIGAREELQALWVTLDFIVASYVVPYPCLALHYPDATTGETPGVASGCEELLNGPVSATPGKGR
jgi:hypothetical protein